MPFSVHSWWVFLCALAAFNVCAWLLAARRPDAHRWQIVLSGFYVFGCAFRCVFPVYDIPRICLVDSWVSSVMIGRSVATIAEVSFAAQWALFLRESARAAGSLTIGTISRLIVPLIVIAEICSWTAVLTTANLGHVFENSLWGLSAALIVIGLASLASKRPSNYRPLLVIWCAAGLAYVAYMFIVDVPMYWARWTADQAATREYLSLAQGVVDASACKLHSLRWEDWRHEIGWMTLYFSGGVWASMSLILVSTRARPVNASWQNHDIATVTPLILNACRTTRAERKYRPPR